MFYCDLVSYRTCLDMVDDYPCSSLLKDLEGGIHLGIGGFNLVCGSLLLSLKWLGFRTKQPGSYTVNSLLAITSRKHVATSRKRPIVFVNNHFVSQLNSVSKTLF